MSSNTMFLKITNQGSTPRQSAITKAFAKTKYYFCICFGNIFAKVIAFKQNMLIYVNLFSCFLPNILMNTFIEIHDFTFSPVTLLYLIVSTTFNSKREHLWSKGKCVLFQFNSSSFLR